MVERAAYSAQELIEAYGISKTKLFKDIRAGLLVKHKVGTRTLFLVSDINAWLGVSAAKRVRRSSQEAAE